MKIYSQNSGAIQNFEKLVNDNTCIRNGSLQEAKLIREIILYYMASRRYAANDNFEHAAAVLKKTGGVQAC
jgi:hypothetical protein